MDKRKLLKSIIICTLLVLVVVGSFFYAKSKDRTSNIDKVIAKYEKKLLSWDNYENDSLYMDIKIDEMEEYSVFTFCSIDRDLEDVIIIISSGEESMSYGIKDSVGSDFVTSSFSEEDGRYKGVKIVFDLSDIYYLYLSYFIGDELIEEYICIE